jgi:DNA-binding transcriptional ArsR family regulator
MVTKPEAKLVTISDPLGIRALAHPARMAAIDVLFGDNEPKTATQLARAVGLSASAMSYHLRLLERYGIVRRVGEPHDGRERPWTRAAANLSIGLRGKGSARAGVVATNAIIAASMEKDRVAIVETQERKVRGDTSVPLDKASRYQRIPLVLTVKESEKLFKDMEKLMLSYLKERRHEIPANAGRLTVTLVAVADALRPVVSPPAPAARRSAPKAKRVIDRRQVQASMLRPK